jgi:hypothetical protein
VPSPTTPAVRIATLPLSAIEKVRRAEPADRRGVVRPQPGTPIRCRRSFRTQTSTPPLRLSMTVAWAGNGSRRCR